VEEARARLELVLERHQAVLKPDKRRGQLPRRSRRVRPLKRLIEERPAWVFLQRVVVRDWDAADVAVRIDRGRRIYRKHGAGFRIERHGAAVQRIAKLGLDERLQIEIDVGFERRRTNRRYVRPHAGPVDGPTTRIDFDELRALASA